MAAECAATRYPAAGVSDTHATAAFPLLAPTNARCGLAAARPHVPAATGTHTESGRDRASPGSGPNYPGLREPESGATLPARELLVRRARRRHADRPGGGFRTTGLPLGHGNRFNYSRWVSWRLQGRRVHPRLRCRLVRDAPAGAAAVPRRNTGTPHIRLGAHSGRRGRAHSPRLAGRYAVRIRPGLLPLGCAGRAHRDRPAADLHTSDSFADCAALVCRHPPWRRADVCVEDGALGERGAHGCGADTPTHGPPDPGAPLSSTAPAHRRVPPGGR